MIINSQEINSEIEDRIEMEIIVDAYDRSERALGWYYYLQDNLSIPFQAECIHLEKKSSLTLGEVCEVKRMADEESCEHDMFVVIQRKNEEQLCVPLKQLKGLDVDNATQQAINDWSYWISQGYSF